MARFKTLMWTENKRTQKINKNVMASFLIKGMSIIVGFLMVRVTLDYLDQTRYGIWLTLSSFLTWFSFFEIGLGSGLRNKLAESFAVKDYELGRIYVSTTYAILGIVIGSVAVLFFIGNSFIDWTVVLNTGKELYDTLRYLALIIFGFFFLRFVVKLISIVLYADQRPALANAFNPIGNLLSLIVILVLTKITKGSLIYLGLTLSILPVLVLIISSIYFYNTKYKNIAPSFKYINFKYSRDLLKLGIKFFLIQLSGLIIYQSSNIIITQFFGPDQVTIYNIAYKYFSVISMGFSIIITPFWSAFTEAWVNNDVIWVKKSIKKLLIVWLILCFIGINMFIFSNSFYHLWIGDNIIIPTEISEALLIYFIVYIWGGIYSVFLNGVGKIKLQMYASMVGAVLFITSSIILIKYFKLGLVGLIWASIISNFDGILLAPIQYYRIINNKAIGIWNK